MLDSVCRGAGRVPIPGECSGWAANVQCCRPENSACLVSTWSTWSSCPQTCNGGTQTRKRDIIAQATGTFAACPPASDPQRLESRRCDVCDACILSAYSNWSGCSKTCGTGQRTRSRTVQQQATCDCAKCSTTLKETQDCNTNPCPVNCAVTPFSEWSDCNAPCGGGQKQRVRTIVTNATNGGTACPPLRENQECNTANCMCTLSNWSNWGGCSTTCGSGLQQRTRTITMQASQCGAALNESQECNLQACPTTTQPGASPTTGIAQGMVGVQRSDGTITVDFCDPRVLPVDTVRETTLPLVGGVNLDVAPADLSDALKRTSCSLSTNNGGGGGITMVFSQKMVLVSVRLANFEASDSGELLFDDGMKKRTTQSVPLRATDVPLETSTFRGHASYTLLMQGTSQFGIESLVLRPPDGKTFATTTMTTRAGAGLEEANTGEGTGSVNSLGSDANGATPEGSDDLLPLWIVLGVLACLILLLIAVYCGITRRQQRGDTVVVQNSMHQNGAASDQYGEMPERRSPTSAGYQPTGGTTAPGYPTQMMGYPNGGGTMPLDSGGSIGKPAYANSPTLGSSSHYNTLDKMPTASVDY